MTPLARANRQKASKKQTGLARYVKAVSAVTADARKIAKQRHLKDFAKITQGASRNKYRSKFKIKLTQKARLLIADGLPSFKVGRGKQNCSKIRANGVKILVFAKSRLD